MARGKQEQGGRAMHPALGIAGPDGDAPDRPGQDLASGFVPVPEMTRRLAVAQPAATAVVCGGRRIDYGTLEAECLRIARWLQAIGPAMLTGSHCSVRRRSPT